ncbi:hypothetical protein HPY28_29500 [Brevibacillus sp. HB1.2]|uniref:hypothetical protein n=1 Tax=Brevibacillus sp. HB1.2 TaxID=2738807 RepID=UPI00157643FD|nr:hypothetical protein [Brevibacillus sp. HB1.2]NTU24450.1 hypothetical protein [Brevibacillus sp. HB1.2]
MALSKSLKLNLLDSTGFFEGNDGYSSVSGDHDEQGMSFGIIQFNFGQGTLAPLLKDYINENEKDFKDILGSSKAATLKKVVFDYSKSKQISWGKSITTKGGADISAEWKKPFQKLGEEASMQKLQLKHAEGYFDRAESLAEQFGIISTQGVAFLFDHAVQSWRFNGSHSKIEDEINDLDREYRNSENGARLPDEDRLSVLLDYIRSGDESDRRRAIKNGRGKVHGKQYDVDDYGLSYDDEF